VAHLGLEPIAPDIVVDSMIVDSGSVSSAIAKLFRGHADSSRKAVATAGERTLVIVKKILVPSMSDQELAETIQKEQPSTFRSISRM